MFAVFLPSSRINHLLGFSPQFVFKMQLCDGLSLSFPSPFLLPAILLKSCNQTEEDADVSGAAKRTEKFIMKHLNEHNVQSRSSLPQSNTYVNFERFAYSVKHIGFMKTGLSEEEGAHPPCKVT